MNTTHPMNRRSLGEQIYECDGSYSEWGDVSCNAGVVTYRENCEPICNE